MPRWYRNLPVSTLCLSKSHGEHLAGLPCNASSVRAPRRPSAALSCGTEQRECDAWARDLHTPHRAGLSRHRARPHSIAIAIYRPGIVYHSRSKVTTRHKLERRGVRSRGSVEYTEEKGQYGRSFHSRGWESETRLLVGHRVTHDHLDRVSGCPRHIWERSTEGPDMPQVVRGARDQHSEIAIRQL
jgi:hypothetical protein